MRWGYITSGPLDDPNAVYHALAGSPWEHPDPKAYRTYLQKLENIPVEAEVDRRKRQVITHPQSDGEDEIFLSWHTSHIAHLSNRQEWEAIAYLMESIHDRFYATSNRAHLYLRLLHYLYALRRDDRILKRLLTHWIQRTQVSPSPETALEYCSFLKPTTSTTPLAHFLEVDPINSATFSLLSRDEKKALIQHLMAGDVTCKLTLLSILMDKGDVRARMTIPSVLNDLMQVSREDVSEEMQDSLQRIAAILMFYSSPEADYDFSPQEAFSLCCWYTKKKSTTTLTELYDALSSTRCDEMRSPVQMMNPVLAQVVEQRSIQTAQIFKQFVNGCRDEDVGKHLLIFANILPINDPQGINKLRIWIGDAASDRLIAMLIFALHPPEMLTLYEKPRVFKKEPYLFIEEVQHILKTFSRHASLNSASNRDIVDQLKNFGMNQRWINRLIDETEAVVLKVGKQATNSFVLQ